MYDKNNSPEVSNSRYRYLETEVSHLNPLATEWLAKKNISELICKQRIYKLKKYTWHSIISFLYN